MENKVTFHINNMAYTITVDDKLKDEITRYLSTDKNLDTKELLAAYIRVSQQYVRLKDDVEAVTEKLPNL
ncbi:hypothetical protein CRV03_00395 [Arcobacter sp. F155]|uniref:hypothetical protein n=2 Tax=Arcobacteraceae TaxID=2808963 RepID=UPI00100B8851|nr:MULTISPECIES: hypothetical protein [unclassified Arcobacter]RXJ78521.1 hypothetical protein CRV03_00395 [Arcobacter sp. F155]RXJ88899.1 hypothetical protein CRV01_09770 [Arcobacter sp. CECT 8983]RXK01981.1 hypothetical protein CRV02_06585 [Arcobacter sp. CECT 8989]